MPKARRSEPRRAAGVLLAAAVLLLGGVGLPSGGSAQPSGGAQAEERRDLRLCNPDGGIRAERTSRGLRIQYLGPEGESTGQPFALRGWEVRAAVPRGGGVCLDLVKPGPAPEEEAKKAAEEAGKTKEPKTGDILRARDEVFETGGAFQEKVIYRRTQKVIELGGERISVEGIEVLHPKGQKPPRRVKRKKLPGRARGKKAGSLRELREIKVKKPKGAVRDDR